MDGLVAARDVDHAEAADAERGVPARVEAVLVGPAMNERGGHPADEGLRDGMREARHPRDAAH
jgi:hypothetical protein